jgi:hypothetical protein
LEPLTRADVIRRIRAMQFWRRDQRAYYREVFGAPDAEPTRAQAAVIQDLRKFCYADARTAQHARDGSIDPLAMALLEGRREVILRILRYLNLSDRALERIEQMELMQRQNVEQHASEETYAA